MNNSYSFIMRDQADDVVKSLMEYDKNIPFIKYLSSISIIGISILGMVRW